MIVTVNVNDLTGKKRERAAESALSDLNRHLAEGWQVVHSFPMSGTGHILCSMSVVILEKE